MPIEITMPKLTDTMTEATLAKWLKKEGDAVKPGDMIAEVETDKATQELEMFEAGTIAKIVVPAGGKTPVGALIVVLAKPGEDVSQVAGNVKGGAASAPAAPTAPAKAQAAPEAKAQQAAPQPPAAAQAGGAKAPPPPPPPAPEPVVTAVMEDHDEGTEQPSGRIRVSPLANRIAQDKRIDLAGVRGSGPGGRIIKRDVLDAASRPAAKGIQAGVSKNGGAAPQPASHRALKLEQKTVPLSNMRQVIAKRLLQSKQSIPHFYVSVDVQMDKLLDMRQEYNDAIAPEKASVTDFIARGVAIALTRVPAVNASFTDTAIIQHGTVELGIAVALDDGLVVPVIRQAHTKDVRTLSKEIKQFAELARSKKLKADQMTGSTFTISNLGMYGVKDFSAIINPPEGAILAVGGTNWQPVVKDVNGTKTIVPGQVMMLTLSCDHRAIDGATGAKFLQELKAILESPLTMIV
jgi:pyruvate dehydrogenase E2 component (dihydrolipoamide acetyltransferase)